MLDIPRMERIRLSRRPRMQIAVATGFLMPNFALRGVEVVFEHQEHLPNEPVIFAMNHTDRYNYWPFQYTLWRRTGRFTATWVKGKYYEQELIGRFMELANNLPAVSRGYIITRDFLSTIGRVPSNEEYAICRQLVDRCAAGQSLAGIDQASLPPAILSAPRDILGRPFDPLGETYPEAIVATFHRMIDRFLSLHEEAFRLGLDLIVFPQGTRSVRLSKGHIGLAEIALKYRKTIIPVGCSGSDRLYPSSSPIARKGRVVYRFGEPIRYEDIPHLHIPSDFTPFNAADEIRHRERFQALVDMVMERIDCLVDEPYRFSQDRESSGVQGTERFI